jgi:hypothetical protein
VPSGIAQTSPVKRSSRSQSTKPVEFRFVEARLLDEVEGLFEPGGNQECTLGRQLAHE